MLTYICDSCEKEFELTYQEATECVYPEAIKLCKECEIERKVGYMYDPWFDEED